MQVAWGKTVFHSFSDPVYWKQNGSRICGTVFCLKTPTPANPSSRRISSRVAREGGRSPPSREAQVPGRAGATQAAPSSSLVLRVGSCFSGTLRLFLPFGPPPSFRLTQALSRRSAHPPSARLLGALSLLPPVSRSGGSLKSCDGLVEAVSLRLQFGQNRVQCQGWWLPS